MSQIGIGALIVVQISGSSLVNTPSDDIMISARGTDAGHTNTSYQKLREMKVNFSGIYRIKFALGGVPIYHVYCQVWRNGSAYGTERSVVGGTMQAFSEDLYFDRGDLIQLYGKSENGSATNITEFLAICGTLALGTVTLDTSAPYSPDLGYAINAGGA
jgi:hypothetical protein